MRHRLLGPAFLSAILIACGGPAATIAPSPTSAPTDQPSPTSALTGDAGAATEFEADLDVGGRTMRIVCAGPTDTGEPTILLEAGLGNDHWTWDNIVPAMSSTHRLCAYDRAGLGRSEPPVESSRTSADQVADLHALLEAAEVGGPFVIGAHSYGATIAILFTQAYPDDVVGLVFVDPQGPRVPARWRDAFPAPSDDEPQAVTDFRDELETLLLDPSATPERLELHSGLTAAAGALDADGPLFGDRSVIVLRAERTPGSQLGLPPEFAATFDEIWAAGQEELAHESTTGSAEVVAGTSHYIQDQEPTVVVAALERILAEVAAPS